MGSLGRMGRCIPVGGSPREVRRCGAAFIEVPPYAMRINVPNGCIHPVMQARPEGRSPQQHEDY